MTGNDEAFDWDDAYANAAHIPQAQSYPPRWASEAEAFRKKCAADGRADLDRAYGDAPRRKMDLFYPAGTPRGLAVFVHGGYWKAFDKSGWSHLAAGPLAHGWAVAMPGYTLCPQATIGRITREIGTAINTAAGIVRGPIRLSGHSAGGHLVSRMNCSDSPLAEPVRARLERTISISGLHDLRPFLKTAMNDVFGLDLAAARAESAALAEPLVGANMVCWVGANERPEFLRQNELLALMWSGLAAGVKTVVEPDRHHFDVIDSLGRVDGALTAELLE